MPGDPLSLAEEGWGAALSGFPTCTGSRHSRPLSDGRGEERWRQISSADLSVGLATSFFSSSLMGKLRFRFFGGMGWVNHLS